MGKVKPRKPTRNQKKWITENGLLLRHWQVLRETKTDLVLIHRTTKEIKTIRKDGQR